MDGYSRTMQWLQRKSTRLLIFVQDPQIFWSKNCLEPHCRTIHPKGERAAGAAKTTGKLGAGRAFGENKGGGGTNKIGLLCDSVNQKLKKKNWISLHTNIQSRTAQRKSFNVPRTILFLSPVGEDG